MNALKKASSTRRSSMLFVLTLIGVLLLKTLQTKQTPFLSHTSSSRRVRIPRSFRGFDLFDPRNLTADFPEEREIRITGYWKEVRASLGLPPLSDLPNAFGVIANPSVALDTISAEDERLLRRLGRLNPALRRRRLVINSHSHPPENETGNRSKLSKGTLYGGGDPEPLLNIEGMRNYGFGDSLKHTQSASKPDDLFLAHNRHGRPRTPVDALAASFRAIAARELKVHRGRSHMSRGN